MARSRSGESVLQRTVRILEVFEPDSTSVSIGDIAKRADLPLSTASRLVEEMIHHGLLRRDSARRGPIGAWFAGRAPRTAPTPAPGRGPRPFMGRPRAAFHHHGPLARARSRP